ncbi:MFS transporter [Trinickia caryophylli]|uniref:Drug resistance transporter, EmrB/QacA subfamily n=1 Tax=Trinickia caryophylli TaxID=28094 RepID=A0A1X7CUV2_TRICW|nr:MFS transporter [Trinickia caryophylli]PMS13405.1 MFS transporter [Trinickia caryophylli]TRX15323.1 MFS transporter [Trinickia caryophylli]WQE15669.1 MFS transporter [Trinickia caryophylli]SMF03615.1 drug resistance transporter, EmrB/QacA subfamily [Trinickia caryophylli]GLU30916.1 MFS transporter [Trinickia caryophylli]
MPLAIHAFISPLIVACALFMESADANIIVTALPSMARDFGSDPVALKVAITSYVVSLGVFIPICGWLADRFGARTVFRTAIGIFIAGSLLCAASRSLHLFTFARFVQGIGGAMMVPVGRIIIFRSVPKSEFVRAMNYLSLPAMFAPAAAPMLGGFITTYLHWRLIFFINVPIGILGVYLTNRYIANTHEPHPGPLDWTGFVLSGLGASLVLLGLSLVGDDIVSDRTAYEMCIGGALLLALYVLYAQRAARPVLDLRFLRIPTFRASVLGGSLFRIGLGAVPFLLPLALQEGLGMSAFQSGLITCASAFGSMFMRSLTSYVLRKFGFRTVLIYNAVFAGIAIAAYGTFTPQTPVWLIWVIVLFGGFFPALQFTSLNSMIYADIAGTDVGRATSLGSVVQQMSLGLGVTVGGIVLQIARAAHGHPQIMWSDFWPAFLVVGMFSLGSIPVTRRLGPHAGDEIARGTRG